VIVEVLAVEEPDLKPDQQRVKPEMDFYQQVWHQLKKFVDFVGLL
jgi:hypothetical protein